MSAFRLSPLLFVLSLSGCGAGPVQPYPAGWPARPVVSTGCSQIAGRYAEATPDFTGGSPPGVQLFQTHGEQVARFRVNGRGVRSRGLRLRFDSARTLHIDYRINGQRVASMAFARSEYVCRPNGLHVVLSRRSGERIYDMFPNRGRSVTSVLLFRVKGYLYAKFTSKAHAIVFHLLPSNTRAVWWARFAAR